MFTNKWLLNSGIILCNVSITNNNVTKLSPCGTRPSKGSWFSLTTFKLWRRNFSALCKSCFVCIGTFSWHRVFQIYHWQQAMTFNTTKVSKTGNAWVEMRDVLYFSKRINPRKFIDFRSASDYLGSVRCLAIIRRFILWRVSDEKELSLAENMIPLFFASLKFCSIKHLFNHWF